MKVVTRNLHLQTQACHFSPRRLLKKRKKKITAANLVCNALRVQQNLCWIDYAVFGQTKKEFPFIVRFVRNGAEVTIAVLRCA